MNRQEKEKHVLELYRQGKTIREIAKIVHMSFGDISSIKRRETGEDEEQNRIRMSKASQALRLFEEGHTPVQVAIKLDIETGEVERLYIEYWKLKGLNKLNEIYAKLKDDMFSFVKLHQLTKIEGMNQQQIVNAVKIAEKLPYLEAESQLINDNIEELNKQKESIRREFNFMLEEVKSAREYKDNQLKSMQEELELAQEHTYNDLKGIQEKSDKQKASLASEVVRYKELLANEVNKCKEYTIKELRSMQERIDKQKQEEQQLTGRIQVLNNEVLEILSYLAEARRKKQQEQFI